ncbi:hypothetical protein M413DRAFT_441439 [Hebeloma cylindrosporum]|uniref:Pre-rRNA-processing protein RIX1 N-terminal domain-containing protein n=1 Tax=Hebeloma cylindrosporum TaxID=76867 RepID=A0A0C3CR29_HEBCY|nr:hypothetical protein M413DRAFT_441439 [Hebeloma cylindrosporum h7]
MGVALPLLSRNETLPTLKAALRLLRVIFTAATDISEFQRQVAVPNVVKFTTATLHLAENHSDIELKILCLETITCLVAIYPTTHRTCSNALTALSLTYLNGSPSGRTNEDLMNAASQLFAALPVIGGKVGAVNLWRKSLDETLAFGWDAFLSLRTTFPNEVSSNTKLPSSSNEPQLFIPLNQDRLRCSVLVLCDLLRATVQRPIQIPFGNLVKFTISLLGCSSGTQIDGFVDPAIRALEISAVSDIWEAGCRLLTCLSKQFPRRLDPHSGRLFSILSFQLEQKQIPTIHLSLIKALDALLNSCHPLDSSIFPTRLAKAVLPSITKIHTTNFSGFSGNDEPSTSKSRNGKKRARNYEGDEVFRTTRQVVCRTAEEGEVLLLSIGVIQSLFRNPHLSPAIQSVIARVIVSSLVSLPRMASSSLSDDPALMQRVNQKIREFSLVIGTGTTSVMSKTLPFIIESAFSSDDLEMQSNIGVLLHPRLPPLIRSMPHVESLALFKAEESQDEMAALSALGVRSIHSSYLKDTGDQDVEMKDNSMAAPAAYTPGHAAPSIPENHLVTPGQSLFSPRAEATDDQRRAAIQLLTQPTKIEVEKPNVDPSSEPYKPTMSFPSTSHRPPAPTVSVPITIPAQEDDDEGEEMPIINMESDSDEDED